MAVLVLQPGNGFSRLMLNHNGLTPLFLSLVCRGEKNHQIYFILELHLSVNYIQIHVEKIIVCRIYHHCAIYCSEVDFLSVLHSFE